MAEATTTGKAKGPLPLSPHMQIWRWHVTMAASIFTRATGVALYGGALIVTGWLASLMLGPDAYACYVGLLGSPLGKLVMFGLTISIFYHLAAGIRHLVFDMGAGFDPRTANMTAVGAFAFSIVASLVVWFLAWQTGGLH